MLQIAIHAINAINRTVASDKLFNNGESTFSDNPASFTRFC